MGAGFRGVTSRRAKTVGGDCRERVGIVCHPGVGVAPRSMVCLGDMTADDKVIGALLGLALGDALGATTEFMARSEVRRRWPEGHREIVGGGVFGWAAGAVTDDTDMALCLVRGIRRAGVGAEVGVLVRAVGEEFMRWRARNPPDIGNTVRLALRLFEEAGDWERVADGVRERLGERAGGNGALMRTLPVSLFWPADERRIVDVGLAVSRMTHPHPEADFCSVAYNLLVAHLVRGGEKESSVAKALARAATVAPTPSRFEGFLDRVFRIDANAISSSGYCVDTLEAALYCFLHERDAEGGIVRAANLGDDADTVAAVAGGLAGAFHGRSGLPSRWLERLDARVHAEILEAFARA